MAARRQIKKQRRVVVGERARYPRGDAGRRRFLRELGLGAVALAALPLVGCEDEHRTSMGMIDSGWQYDQYVHDITQQDSGPGDGFHSVDMFGIPDSPPAQLDLRTDGANADGAFADGTGASDAAPSDARRPDGGIPDGAGDR